MCGTDKVLKMRPKIRTILEKCIETGIRLGHTRAHKHSDKPEDEYFHALDKMVAFNEKHGLYDL